VRSNGRFISYFNRFHSLTMQFNESLRPFFQSTEACFSSPSMPNQIEAAFERVWMPVKRPPGRPSGQRMLPADPEKPQELTETLVNAEVDPHQAICRVTRSSPCRCAVSGDLASDWTRNRSKSVFLWLCSAL
jgi:hypothetical protein